MRAIAPVPPLPAPDWTYDQARGCEDSIQAHIEEHGVSAEALHRLAQLAVSRCAYRRGIVHMQEATRRWPDFAHPLTGLNGRLLGIQCAIHAGDQDAAASWVRDISANSHVISNGTAECIAAMVRGTGLQPEAREVLSLCLERLARDTPLAEMVSVLVGEYEEIVQLAAAVRLISLGSGCYSWLQPNRYMLRHIGAQDQLMPFNLAVTVEAGIATALEDGLSGLCDPSEFDISTFLRGTPVARHRRYAMLFNHDCDEEILMDNMAGLLALCTRRAAAFRHYAATGPRVFLYWGANFDGAQRLEQALAGLMQDEQYRLLLIASQHGMPPGRSRPLLPTTRMIHVPVPTPGYNWTLSDTTPEGYRYDLTVRRAIVDTMRDLANS